MSEKYRDYRWFKNNYHYRGKTIEEMAEECGASPSTLFKWRKKHGVERRATRSCPESHMPRLVNYLYVEKGYSISELAEHWGVGFAVAERAVNEYVPKEKRKRAGDHGLTTGPDGKVELECPTCGEPVYRYPSRVEVNENAFCNMDCRGEYDSQYMTGEDNPAWKGGYGKYYGENWEYQRKETLKRDGYECRACGMTQEQHKEVYGFDIEVHHVVPVRKFDDPVDANSLGNLVTACRGCHTKYEGMPVFPDSP